MTSVTTIYRKHKLETSNGTEHLRKKFKSDFKTYLKVLHWDGKIMDVVNKNGATEKDVNAVVLTVPVVPTKLQ